MTCLSKQIDHEQHIDIKSDLPVLGQWLLVTRLSISPTAESERGRGGEGWEPHKNLVADSCIAVSSPPWPYTRKQTSVTASLIPCITTFCPVPSPLVSVESCSLQSKYSHDLSLAGLGWSWRRGKCLQMIDTKPQTRDYSNLGQLISNFRWKITHITEILWDSDQTRRGCSWYSCLHPVFSNFTNYQLDHAMTAEILQRSLDLARKMWIHIAN